MKNRPFNCSGERGFSRLETFLFLLILGTLIFLAVPVYNSVQLSRQNQMEEQEDSAPKTTPKVLDSNTSAPLF
ncbi:MAG: hypothetical protein CMI31_05135 [Opitutae bacterium]|nr:hypothetical protein [Opitutae bacterium]|tara:strand:- start:381 stop:599 length:219 start_codon:yes stop_codon:yes gene_type:complete